jgi:amidase
MTPIANGSDSGGSLRNPAAFCNVVGIRPAAGRVPSGASGNAWSTVSVNGPMARNVSDLALQLQAVAGPDLRCPISITEPASLFGRNLERSFKGVRMAWFRNMGGIPFDPRIPTAVNAQRAVFEQLGCVVEEAEPDWTGAHEGYDILRAWGYAASHADDVRLHRDLVKDTVIWEVERGLRLSGADVTRGHSLRSRAWDQMRIFQEKYEYFITPTTQVLPFDVKQPYPEEINGVKMSNYVEWQNSCVLISALENPSISVPCGFVDGLPVGMQIVGRHRDEWGVLQIAHAFEQATDWHKRRPSL